jgi:O-antigen ligase
LAYCLLAALNAAATYHPETRGFTYQISYRKWLPHSFDIGRTWSTFWEYLALGCAFWAIADWLPGKTAGEERAARQPALAVGTGPAPLLPARLRRLLWVLCINGALVGLEGIAQRLEGSGHLLFLLKPAINQEAVSQFGPYHYRANAAAYFNLIWPVCLGFWWTLHRSAGLKRTTHHVLLLCGIVMAACPIISTSRGGALVAAGILALAAFFLVATHFLLVAHRQEDKQARKIALVLLVVFFTTTLALGCALGWSALRPRLAQLEEGFENREEMYAAAKPMAADYPVFGTGPGTFDSVFQLYRISTETYWPAQLHNDWLETRITFGWFGFALIVLALITVLVRWFARGGLHGGRRFMILLWLALAGCLVHARFDFPFQVYSILFLFLVWCAVAFNLSRRP